MIWPINSLNDDHDPHVQAWLRKILRPGDIFYDIGANTGIMSRVAASCGAHVYVIEPNPNSLRVLLNTSTVSGWVRCALWDKVEGLRLHFPTMEHSAQAEVYEAAPDTLHDMRVNGVSLDCLTQDFGWPSPTVIKSDTQGCEVLWLRGATISLNRCRSMILEICESVLAAHGSSEQELLDLVNGLGFDVEVRIDNDILVVRSDVKG